ncbi:flagellar type III secretion system pore protein FliP [Parvularcula dongshanensis]|uniref:Flagellar biosynthetic protein FliP n=1 Tax=Parvularcula dongshanensis TaxID=1173995 RepID=A0A840I6J3_9PROT|nr:flagellar biosynthetic protein FliP [Parvularcula dongshanensis]
MRAALALFLFALLALGPAAAQEPEGLGTALQALAPEEGTSLRAELIPLFLVVTVLSLAPGLLMMVTCLPLMVIVFSFLRQAIGLQQAPPNMMITSLALFLTFFVMEPVFTTAWEVGIEPLRNGEITEVQAFDAVIVPFRSFMEARTHESTLMTLSEALPGRWDGVSDDVPLSLLVPSFMLSEIKTAFQIGFAVFLPFLVIDLVVASVLMAMGMMMVPPAVVSLPFKLAFFVLADGWTKIAAALLRGYAG